MDARTKLQSCPSPEHLGSGSPDYVVRGSNKVYENSLQVRVFLHRNIYTCMHSHSTNICVHAWGALWCARHGSWWGHSWEGGYQEAPPASGFVQGDKHGRHGRGPGGTSRHPIAGRLFIPDPSILLGVGLYPPKKLLEARPPSTCEL